MRKVIRCFKVKTPPVVDGRLDDEVWAGCPEVTLVDTQTGESVNWATKARMCWDDSCLYVAFDSIDQDIWGTMTGHNDPIYDEEVVEIFLEPDNEPTRYFEIEVSPRNVIFEAEIVNTNGLRPNVDRSNYTWRCEGMRTAVIVDGTLDDRTDTDRGWTVEMALPFAPMHKTPQPGERWRANLYRIDRGKDGDEYQAWSPTLAVPASFHVPAEFGEIEFLDQS